MGLSRCAPMDKSRDLLGAGDDQEESDSLVRWTTQRWRESAMPAPRKSRIRSRRARCRSQRFWRAATRALGPEISRAMVAAERLSLPRLESDSSSSRRPSAVARPLAAEALAGETWGIGR